MTAYSKITPTLPAVDLDRARKFYHEKLGLKINMEEPGGIMFESGDGSLLYLYKRGPTTANHTVASFQVEGIDSEVRRLRGLGIKFEEYDIPSMGLKTINGIATMSSKEYETKSAWFKDTEGNILALVQMVKSGSRVRGEEIEKVGSRR